MENKVYTQDELERENIITSEYHLNLEPGEFVARLDLKAVTRKRNALRVFFTFEDKRKVIATVHWFNQYLGFYERPVGVRLRLVYTAKLNGDIYLTEVKEVV